MVKKQISQFYRTQGEIVTFKLHPSLEYILVLTKNGVVFIFNIADGDIRGKISVEADSNDLEIDPAGLYFAISTPM